MENLAWAHQCLPGKRMTGTGLKLSSDAVRVGAFRKGELSMVKTTVVNSYPKISSVRGEVNLRNAINRRESGKIDDADLEQAFQETIRRTIREQQEVGLDLITDGLIRWDDPVSRFCSNVGNLNRGGLLRFFDNNVYYRRPTIDGDLSVVSPTSAEDYLFASKCSSAPMKAVLPGPATFRAMCEDRHYHDEEKLFREIEGVLAGEVEALAATGCHHIQFDEPSLPFYPEFADRSIGIINRLSEPAGIEFWVYFYFGDLDTIRVSLKKYRVSVIGADCVSRTSNRNTLLDSGADCSFCFGIANARNLKLETPHDLMDEMKEVADRLDGKDFWISPSCSLEFLPQDYAQRKLKVLTDAARSFGRGE
jgi:5-methyltetrahydropteroyltriglutamate--homocysteine methyltransferase